MEYLFIGINLFVIIGNCFLLYACLEIIVIMFGIEDLRITKIVQILLILLFPLYLSGDYLKDQCSFLWSRDQYYVYTDYSSSELSVVVKIPPITYGLAGMNQYGCLVDLQSVSKSVYSEVTGLKGYIKHDRIPIHLYFLSEDKYGNRVEKDQGITVVLEKKEVKKYKSWEYFSKDVNLYKKKGRHSL